MSTTEVYLVCEEEDGPPFKVGIATRSRQRLGELQTGNPRSLRLVRAWPLPTRDRAREFERQVHIHFETARLRGEWFFLDLQKSLDFITEEHSHFCRAIARGYI